jgi:serine/threonine protein kinase
MGVVLAAKHLQLDETVALKFLRAHASSDPDALARFTREARAAAKLKSEHVARVLDAGIADDATPYTVMEYLEGRTLGRVLADQGRLDATTATEYAIQACEGLAEAHARGIVHRDIKPENLFLVERSQGWRVLKILDFGISKFDVPRGPGDGGVGPLRDVPNSPNHLASLKAAAPIVGSLLNATTRLSFVGPRLDKYDQSTDPPQGTTPSALVWDVVISGQAERFGLHYALGLYNAMNYRYTVPVSREFLQESIAQNGRTLLLSAQLTF